MASVNYRHYLKRTTSLKPLKGHLQFNRLSKEMFPRTFTCLHVISSLPISLLQRKANPQSAEVLSIAVSLLFEKNHAAHCVL